jgi:uncharacterized repeat protein (TIGR01451 family)
MPHVVLRRDMRLTTERQGGVSPQHDPKLDQSEEGLTAHAGAGRFLALRSWRRAVLAVVLAIVAAVLPWPSLPAMAVHDTGLFELDGNATASASLAGDDWDALFPLPGGGAAQKKSFIDDGTDEATNPPVDGTYFTGGGSKDVNALGAPDKDEITNAYAAAYASGSDTYIYFGLDRFDGSGSANAGFWFFQNPISLDADGTFSGVHTPGDIFVVSEFTNGGAISTIKVYAWDTTQANNLREVMSGADCSTAPANDNVCARVNSGPIPAPWQYAPKSGAAGTFPAGSFLEGGVKLSSLFPAMSVPCFSSFLAETRTSFTPNSQLADFALGSFELCGLNVEKTGDTLSKATDPAHYVITITNTGIVPLFKQNIVDSLLGDITAQNIPGVTSTCTASLAPLGSCTITYDRTVLPGDTDPLVNTVTATYNPLANFGGTAITDTDSHSVNLFQPRVEVTKTADPVAAVVGQGINYTITITNASSSDSPNLVLDSISDPLLGGDITASAPAACLSLAPGANCTFLVARAVQSGDPDPLINTVTVHYHPDGFPNDITDTDSATVNILQPGINVTKTGDDLSKRTDDVTYSFTINNSGQTTLVMDATSGIVDDVLGNLTSVAPNTCASLAPGGSCQFSRNFTVPMDAPDPLINTVNVLYHPQGVPTVNVTASFSHTLNLFQPSVDLTKSGPATGIAGQTVTYTFSVRNTGSADSPDLLLATATDDVLGNLVPAAQAAGCDRLVVSLNPCVFTVLHTLAATPDPLTNTASVLYHPEGFPNDIRDTASHTLNLFQPSVSVVKSGDTLSKVGDDVTYTFTITNTSSVDTPDLVLSSVVDDKLGSLTAQAAAAGCSTLASEASCNFNVTKTVLATDADPLVNVVDVIFTVTGFPAVSATASDNHSLNLFVPGVDVTKTADVAAAKVGDIVTYTITITNKSSEDSPNLLLDSVIDSLLGSVKTQATTAGCDTLTFNESCNFKVTRAVKASDADPVVNTVIVHYHPAEFLNDITDTASATVDKIVPPPTYGQDPDDDLPVEDPYDLAGDPGGPASPIDTTTPIDTAGNNNQTGTEQPAAPAPADDVLENHVAVPPPSGQLPRTGRGLDQVTKVGAALLFLGGLAVMTGRRRKDRKA